MKVVDSGDTLAGRYRIADRIPTDIRDVDIWSAHDQILDRLVRLVIVSGEHRDDALDSARRAALVQDPRLVRVLDVGVCDDVFYVVTESAEGQTLGEIVTAGIVDPQQARAIVGEAAAALEKARERGVHHLTIRPSAVLVDGSKVVITGLGVDAGIAGLNQRDATMTSRVDAQCLVALFYYLTTARWPGPSLDVSWIDPQAIQPLAARRREGAILSLSEIRSDVPSELVALCDETFDGYDGSAIRWDTPTNSGPATVAELAECLRPWGEVSVVAAVPAFIRTEQAGGVNRQSVRMSFGSSVVPPGTPPPATPARRPAGRIHRVDPMGPLASTRTQSGVFDPAPPLHSSAHGAPAASGTSTTASRQPARPPQVAWPSPTAESPPKDPHESSTTNTAPHSSSSAPSRKRGRFNPTGIMLLLALGALIGGVAWALGTAFQGFSSPLESRDQSTEGSVTTTDSGGGQEDTDREGALSAPVISTGEALDPEGGANQGEHPEDAGKALDGVSTTAWATRTYKNAQFGNLKSGVGYAIVLQDKAAVSSITLTTGNTGGHVEVRATSPDRPTSGEVLAAGSLSPTTVLQLSQSVEAQSLVLWFSELPQSADGGYRVEIIEITVS